MHSNVQNVTIMLQVCSKLQALEVQRHNKRLDFEYAIICRTENRCVQGRVWKPGLEACDLQTKTNQRVLSKQILANEETPAWA